MSEPVYQAKDGFVKRVIAGETLLVPVGERTQTFNGMVTLNETGSFLWDLLKEPITRAQLTALMTEEFEAAPEAIARDVDEFLAIGVKNGLISCTGGETI